MADTKIIFIAFAIEDERQRDFLKGQTLSQRAPYEFVDMSVKDPFDTGWKDKVRTRIRRSAGVIVLVSKNSLTPTAKSGRSSAPKTRVSRCAESGPTGTTAPISPAPAGIQADLEADSLLDRLAAVEHARWAHWQRYLHDQCLRTDDDSLLIPAELVKRWSAQIETEYSELSEAERESDHNQVRRYPPVILEALTHHPEP